VINAAARVVGVARYDHALGLLSVSRTLLQCHMFSDIVPGLLVCNLV
jgi:hypothetical protein